MNECILNIHMSLQQVLEEMSAVIHRKTLHSGEHWDTLRPDDADYDASTLRPTAETAVMEMGKWSGEGSLPQILDAGNLFVSAGTGKVVVFGDEVTGYGTAFRTEVQVGDILTIEPLLVQKNVDFASKKTFALDVTVVLSQTRLKVGTFLTESLSEPIVFVIARAKNRSLKIQFQNTLSAGMAANAPKQISPRSSQRWFEWDLHTQKRDIMNLRDAEAHNAYLKKLKKEAEFELLTVLERPLLRMCFQAMKSQVKQKQKTVSLLW